MKNFIIEIAMFQRFNITEQSQQNYCVGTGTIHQLDKVPLQLPYANLLICQSGHAQICVNFKKYNYKQGDILFISDDSIVTIQESSADFSIFYCLMARSFASEVAYVLPTDLFSYLRDYPHSEPSDDYLIFIWDWIAQMNFLLKNSGNFAWTTLRNHLQNFFLIMVEQADDLNIKNATKHSRKEMICWQFWELIQHHCYRERAVAFYANLLSITPYYLSQLTQDLFNDSPKTLIDRQVILEIKKKLIQTKEPIEVIADAMNFNDPSYLCRYFKRHTGISLSQFRKTGLK